MFFKRHTQTNVAPPLHCLTTPPQRAVLVHSSFVVVCVVDLSEVALPELAFVFGSWRGWRSRPSNSFAVSMLRRHCPSQRRAAPLSSNKLDPFSQEVYDANSQAVSGGVVGRRMNPRATVYCCCWVWCLILTPSTFAAANVTRAPCPPQTSASLFVRSRT